jgi:hypothetical protein
MGPNDPLGTDGLARPRRCNTFEQRQFRLRRREGGEATVETDHNPWKYKNPWFARAREARKMNVHFGMELCLIGGGAILAVHGQASDRDAMLHTNIARAHQKIDELRVSRPFSCLFLPRIDSATIPNVVSFFDRGSFLPG